MGIMSKMRYQLYECEDCKEKFITDNKTRWTMVGCKEGCSMVDAEEGYSRMIGKPQLIKESDTIKDLKDGTKSNT